MLCPTSGPRGAPSTQRRMPSVPVSQRKPSTCSPGRNGAPGGWLSRCRRNASIRATSSRICDSLCSSPAAGAAGAAASGPFSSTKSLGPKALSACFTSGSRSSRWRSRARAAGPSRGSKASHACRSSRAWAISGAAIDGLSSAKKASRSGATARPASARAAWRRTAGSTAPRVSRSRAKARSRRSSDSAGRWASRSTSWRHCAARRSGRSAG